MSDVILLDYYTDEIARIELHDENHSTPQRISASNQAPQH